MRAELFERVAQRAAAPEDEVANDLYSFVKQALDEGADREELRELLSDVYSQLRESGHNKERRAVGEVLVCFDGWCAPSATL